MKLKTLMLVFIFFIVAKGYSQDAVLYPEVKKQLDSLANLDVKAGRDMRTTKIENRDSLRKIFRETTVRNTEVLKQIFYKYGFPNYDKVGKEASKNFWLCVQHSDHDLKFQQQVLKKMKVEVKRKKADPSNYAWLTDRVNVNSGKSQIYGTQLDYKADGTPIPKKLKDPETVNDRRKEIGLEPIEDYLEFVKEAQKQNL
ncbi:DUF6624 domain-containing protein [Pedobacter foliorum]|uniref:DUF6624 domain-containing protein n=1 Tax=Pedobacter foliorum TaxID=2739058 RepID=UPI001565DE8F|nr:DUF6624 domain-containing protein [Pedobacter foliorum]NRF39329.1 hypothetical protein [Pedobacter foliorum]